MALCVFTAILAAVDPRSVKFVHLVQSNHLDVGFSDYVSQVMNRYLTGGWGTDQPPAPRWKRVYYDSFLLGAANTSRILRNRGGEARYVYTQNPWVMHLFFHCNETAFPWVREAERLRCPTAAQRQVMIEALRRGDTAMHAFPTSAQAELFDAGTFDAGLRMGPVLLSALGLEGDVVSPSVMQQRDVPGLTRAVVPLLARRGVVGISVGANDGSPAPTVPSTAACQSGLRQLRTPFRWHDVASNTSVLMDIHPGGYGGVLPTMPSGEPYFARDGLLCDCVGVEGLDHALCYSWRGDNYGPAGPNETERNFALFGAAFPNARVAASTLDAFFQRLLPLAHTLPTLTSEIGDTWMYGVASDPSKTAQLRAMMRQRSRCVAQRACDAHAEPHLAGFSHLLHKLGEHTWGGSYAGHMNVSQPDGNWSNAAFERERARSVRRAPGADAFYRVAEATWDEQRLFIDAALAALDAGGGADGGAAGGAAGGKGSDAGGGAAGGGTPDGGASPSKLAASIRAELRELAAPPVADPMAIGYRRVPPHSWTLPRMLGGAAVGFDAATGAMTRYDVGGVSWASPSEPLLRFAYRTFSYAEKVQHSRTYGYRHGGPHPYPRCTPNCPPPGAVSGATAPMHADKYYAPIIGMWARAASSVLLQLNGSAIRSGYASFGSIWLNVSVESPTSAAAGVGAGAAGLRVELVWTGKQPTRLPEAAWLELRPALRNPGQPPPLQSATGAAGHASNGAAWKLRVSKLGSLVDTADVVHNGGASMHGIDPDGAVEWSRRAETASEPMPLGRSEGERLGTLLRVQSLDAALVAPGGGTSPYEWDRYNAAPVDPLEGAAFNLHNNLYDTNYVLWYPWRPADATGRFRFHVAVQ